MSDRITSRLGGETIYEILEQEMMVLGIHLDLGLSELYAQQRLL